MSLKMRITLAFIGMFFVVSVFAIVFESVFLPLVRPLAKVERAITRAYPQSRPRISIMSGEKSGDRGMLQIEVKTAENPEEQTASARAMAVKSAQFAKLYYPMADFSHIRVVTREGKHAKTFLFSTTQTASAAPVKPVLASPFSFRRAGTDIR